MAEEVSKILIKAGADFRQAIGEFHKLAQAQNESAKAAHVHGKAQESSLGKLGQALMTFNQSLEAVNKVAGLLKDGLGLAKHARETESFTRQLEKLAGKDALGRFQEAADHSVTKAELLRMSLKALQGDAKITARGLDVIYTAADTLADKGFGETAETAEMLITALRSGAPAMGHATGHLRMMGIELGKGGDAIDRTNRLWAQLLEQIANPPPVDPQLAEIERLNIATQDWIEMFKNGIGQIIALALSGLMSISDALAGTSRSRSAPGRAREDALLGVKLELAKTYRMEAIEGALAAREMSDLASISESDKMMLEKIDAGVKIALADMERLQARPKVDTRFEDLQKRIKELAKLLGGGGAGRGTGRPDKGPAQRIAALSAYFQGQYGDMLIGGGGEGIYTDPGIENQLIAQALREQAIRQEFEQRMAGADTWAGYQAQRKKADAERMGIVSGGIMGLSAEQSDDTAATGMAALGTAAGIMASGVQAAIDAAITGQESIPKALGKAVALSMKALAVEAGGRAVLEGAYALAALALGDAASATLHGLAAAKFASAAVLLGGGAALLGASTGAFETGKARQRTPAGGGYATPSGGGRDGGTTINVFVGEGFVGAPDELANEIDRKTNQARRSGRIRSASRVVQFA